MNDLIKDIVREMILNGEIRLGIIEENGLYHIGLEVVEDEVTKQSIWDSINLQYFFDNKVQEIYHDIETDNFLDNYR